MKETIQLNYICIIFFFFHKGAHLQLIKHDEKLID